MRRIRDEETYKEHLEFLKDEQNIIEIWKLVGEFQGISSQATKTVGKLLNYVAFFSSSTERCLIAQS